jgi:hypothetical protein
MKLLSALRPSGSAGHFADPLSDDAARPQSKEPPGQAALWRGEKAQALALRHCFMNALRSSPVLPLASALQVFIFCC